jgi:hypothetical protein
LEFVWFGGCQASLSEQNNYSLPTEFSQQSEIAAGHMQKPRRKIGFE